MIRKKILFASIAGIVVIGIFTGLIFFQSAETPFSDILYGIGVLSAESGNENMIIGFGAVMFILVMAAAAMMVSSNRRLDKLNRRLNELLKENYEVGKILVKRDMELTEANVRLTGLDESKSEFVSVVAHQLRTPLTGIRWTFNALLDREFGDLNIEQQKVVEDGLKSSIRMIDLINDLLNVARIEEGKFGLHLKRQSFAKLMDDVVGRIRRAAEEKGITLLLDIASNLPLVEIDEEKIALALENVLDNAIKYTAPGGKVMVNASAVQEAIKIVIADTGIGIPKSQMERLFSKFFRADNALRFQTSGSGLGLYVVKNIVQGHGGSVSMTSGEQQGTTVTILLPIKEQRG